MWKVLLNRSKRRGGVDLRRIPAHDKQRREVVLPRCPEYLENPGSLFLTRLKHNARSPVLPMFAFHNKRKELPESRTDDKIPGLAEWMTAGERRPIAVLLSESRRVRENRTRNEALKFFTLPVDLRVSSSCSLRESAESI